jgi:proteasome lid subunit RPN8/RPN11
MAEIEWQETQAFRPAAGSARAFCLEHGLSPSSLPDDECFLVFVDRRALESLHDFLGHDLQREHGGVLLGRAFVDPGDGQPYAVIEAAVPALDTEGSSVHLQFTPEAWAYISGIIEENYPDLVVIGWYHSHPGLGVFMSDTDRATQRAFFSHPWSVAVVSDPLLLETGWFAGPECQPLGSGQVIQFEKAAGKAAAHEREFGGERPTWRWLLPFGMALLGALALAWRHRKNGAARPGRLF